MFLRELFFYHKCLYQTSSLQPNDYKKMYMFSVSYLFYFLIFFENLFLALLQPSRKEMVPFVWHDFFCLAPQNGLKGKIMKVS
jgi:hypothetical protein